MIFIYTLIVLFFSDRQVFADNCFEYLDVNGKYVSYQDCDGIGQCCGTCDYRYCCNSSRKYEILDQSQCKNYIPIPRLTDTDSESLSGFVIFLIAASVFISCLGFVICITICCRSGQTIRENRYQVSYIANATNRDLPLPSYEEAVSKNDATQQPPSYSVATISRQFNNK